MTRTDENGSDDALRRRLHEASRRAGDVGQLPPSAAVRARGDRRRHRRTAASALAALVVVAGAAGGAYALSEGRPPAPVPPASSPATPEPTPSTLESPTTAQLTDGTRRVDVRTYADTFLVPRSEGGFTVTADPAAAVPTTWVVAPADGRPDRYSVQATMTREGRPYCLDVADASTVDLTPCDPTAATQRFSLGGADFEGQVTIGFDGGYLTVDGSGQLATSSTNTSPAELFTLEDRGPV